MNHANEHFDQVSCLYLHVHDYCHFPLYETYEFGGHLEISAILKMEKFAMANEKIFTGKV